MILRDLLQFKKKKLINIFYIRENTIFHGFVIVEFIAYISAVFKNDLRWSSINIMQSMLIKNVFFFYVFKCEWSEATWERRILVLWSKDKSGISSSVFCSERELSLLSSHVTSDPVSKMFNYPSARPCYSELEQEFPLGNCLALTSFIVWKNDGNWHDAKKCCYH